MALPTSTPLGAQPAPLPFTVDELKSDLLFGIPLTVTTSTGERVTYPDTAITRCVKAAMNTFERRLQVDLGQRKVVCRPAVTQPKAVAGVDYDIAEDPLDYNSVAYYANGYIRLRRWPITSVEKLELRFPESTSIFSYPADWLRITHKSGQIAVLAIAGAAQPGIVGREGGYLPLLTGGFLQADVPQLIYSDYTSGLDFRNPLVQNEYQDLILALQKQAAANVLQAVGRGFRPGIQNESLSEDGQSESTTYARGKGGIFQPEVDSLLADVEAFLLSFKNYWKGIVFTVL